MKQNNQPHTIALIACSKSKDGREGLLPAKERYTGKLFKAQLRYAREVLHIPDDCVFILSPKYFMITLSNGVSNDAEDAFCNMSYSELGKWGNIVCDNQIAEMSPSPKVIYVLAGMYCCGAIGWLHFFAGVEAFFVRCKTVTSWSKGKVEICYCRTCGHPSVCGGRDKCGSMTIRGRATVCARGGSWYCEHHLPKKYEQQGESYETK